MALERQERLTARGALPLRGRAAAPGRRFGDDPRELPERLSRRVVVENIEPMIDGGRFPIKRTVGESVDVAATIFGDGHDVIVAVLRYRPLGGGAAVDAQSDDPTRTVTSGRDDSAPVTSPAEGGWFETPMTVVNPGIDRWAGSFVVREIGRYEFAITAWVDHFRTWKRDLQIKAAAGQDVSIELLEGSVMIRDAAVRAERYVSERARAHADCLVARAEVLTDGTTIAGRVAAAVSDNLAAMMEKFADRSRATTSPPAPVWVDRERARFGAWYEMFPRSAGPESAGTNTSGTFSDAAAVLPRLADLGFDVVYLPPIHPIGKQFRKGRNNSLVPAPGDPGSPWAIGSEEGGHTAVEPGLGTLDDFMAFRARAEQLGLEVALDLAWQSSPDHPWVREHPDWFRHRPDGTIKYAENPPKKYQDIYPFDFESEDWRGLWRALLDVTLFWVDRGVRIFRVDNPHTKVFSFWEWLIREVHARHPDVIFLAEAFTRPPVMRYLAKVGFTQSYTYFTWRNTKSEITEYLTELTTTDVREYLRPNLFANTPDILHAYLQNGGKPAFEARLLLAATLGASYGIYSGFELCENRAVPGTEEYADSEKYQYRRRDWSRPGHIQELIARVNRIRHQHRPLQFDFTLRFHTTDNPYLIAYSKSSPDAGDSREVLLMVVNLDPHHMQHGFVQVPLESIGSAEQYTALDLLDDTRYFWRGDWNYVRLEPGIKQGHILKLERTDKG
jgi:starch synthase (maltosyl-transferring)